MDKAAIYRELEKEFLSTFMGELIPGVLHNFANPLNGIMGRAKLLQRRLEESIKKMEVRYPGFSQDFGAEKIIKDINTISGESDRFFNLFRDLSDKFATLSCQDPAPVNLSRLIESEMRFADFYLDFKHEVQKNIQLDNDVPTIMGNAADLSLAIFSLLASAKERMKHSPVKELLLRTGHDASCVSLTIQDSGEAIPAACQPLAEDRETDLDFVALPQKARGICGALSLLKHDGARVQLRCADGVNLIMLSIPYRF